MLLAKRFVCALVFLVLFPAGVFASGVSKEVRDLYSRFYTAQNARDLDQVVMLIADAPEFLWVSDGKSIWGRREAIERMKGFQQAAIWRVEPDLQGAKVVEVSGKTAYLHLKLDLVIGAVQTPDRLRFLVSALCVKTGQGWKIAALFTTTAKPE